MKTNLFLLTMLAGTLPLASCDKNNPADELPGPQPPAVSTQAEAALKAKYPAATNVVWQTKQGYVVADFSLAEARAAGAAELSAWFDNGGAWYMTETDIPFAALPEAVQTAFNGSEYAAAPWQVDDVDKLEREGVETIYVVEVEKRENGSKTEVDLYYAPDGVLVKKIADAAPDYDYGDYIPSKPATGIEEYIRQNYPNARITEIDHERGMTEVDIVDGRTPRELLFDGSDSWLYTKTEVHRTEVPQPVMTALQNSQYASYWIDDIDHYLTPDKEFWRFDLESAQGDVKVDITADGELTLKQPGGGNTGGGNTGGNTGGGNHGQGNGGRVNATAAEFIAQKYPGAQIMEYDREDGLLEVEIWHEGREKNVFFNGQNAWVYTEWDIRRGELPQAVTAAIAASEWSAFGIDDIEYVQTPASEYYLVELERGSQEVKLRITAEGAIL